jgi:hypothetical protein
MKSNSIPIVFVLATGCASPQTHIAQMPNEPYTITTVTKIAEPYRVQDMNDEFQSAELLNESGRIGTFRITYRPFHVQTVGSNPNWKKDDAKMQEYLRPRPAANWDPDLQRRILADLAKAGIDPDKLDDRTLVEKVSDWALKRSQFNSQFGLWMVEFENGVPTIPSDLRPSYTSQEPVGLSEKQVFDRELFGKGMYLNQTHGACTSTSTYMATILRAIGIPTRIILTVPACDGNDPNQVKLLTKAVRHHQTAQAIRLAGGSKGFVNHVFNEVFVGGKWVRLNYNRLAQPIVDANYGGLLTHVYTTTDISEVPFAKTWGARFALERGPTLSSVNPYQLVSAKDDLQIGTVFDNPVVETLTSVTVIQVLKKGDPALPAWAKLPADADAFLSIKEWIAGQNYMQLRDFESEAATTFTLTSPGHPTLTASLNGLKVSDERGGFQAFAVKLSGTPAPGVIYSLFPQNHGHAHTWKVDPKAVWKG